MNSCSRPFTLVFRNGRTTRSGPAASTTLSLMQMDGSYGWVWKAQRVVDGAIVAVKIPKAQGKRNEELAEGSFLIGQVPHPCVVDVYWMGRVPLSVSGMRSRWNTSPQ
jgi:hypothetical protein